MTITQLRQNVRNLLVGATLSEAQEFQVTARGRGDTECAGYAEEFIREVCMDELDIAIETTVWDLRAALKGLADPIMTIDCLNRVIIAARISPIKGYTAGCLAWFDIMSCAHFAKRYCDVLSDHLRCIANDYRKALNDWYQNTI